MNHEIPLPWHPFVWDVNDDGSFTVTDLGMWLQHVFFLPGDWIIWMMLRYAPGIGRFMEVDAGEYGSTVSALLSVFSWLGLIVLIMTTSHYLTAADRAVTSVLRSTAKYIVRRFNGAYRALRETSKRSRDGFRGARARVELPQLSTEELRVLKAHAYVEPTSSLALSDLVRATGVPRAQIVVILDRLREMHLLDRRADSETTEPGYRLTDPGRDLLSAHRV